MMMKYGSGNCQELSRFWQEIVSRPDGPMAFRFQLQPGMSTIFAIMSGLEDAREHSPACFWAIFTDRAHRADLLRDGWKSVRNVFLLAAAMDLVYQITTQFAWAGCADIVQNRQ